MNNSAKTLNIKLIGRRTIYGRGRLQGTVLDSEGAPFQQQVAVFLQDSHKLANREGARTIVARVNPDPDGAWEVTYLEQGRFYTVVAHDPSGNFDPVMKANLIPEPME